ncbi:MAG TPA: VCBS repeat-containing protein [Pyrinomonadaceae bacterium]|nr:VCBS repeat-containing protein [Pyrinomonadaceae bacterium]
MRKLLLAVLILELLSIGCNMQTRGSKYAAAPDVPFRAIHLAAGTHPDMVNTTDVNKDGHIDILAANSDSNNVSVYLGDGKGGFSPAPGSPFAAGQNPSDIAVADFNGDGKSDIAVANHGVKTVTVLLGNGKGQFALAPGSPFNVESRPHPHGIAVADFNGDKMPDVAVDSWGENKVLVIFGKGDGTFQTPGMKFETGKMPYHRLRAADLNSDGTADIVTSNFEAGSVSVLFGDGRGNFTRKDFPTPPNPFGIALADLNGDRHLDIAVVHYSGQGNDPSKNALSVLFGDGKENFLPAKGSPFSTGNYPATLATGDLNGDGIADIVVPNSLDGTLTIYFGGRSGITPAAYSPMRVGRTPQGVAVADLNHDGKGDIIVAEEEDNDVLVLFGK